MSTYLKYSYDFGQRVVEQFSERYARGTLLLCKLAGISHKTLCVYLIKCVRADKQIRWESMKRLIKAINTERWEDFKGLSVKERRDYLTRVKWIAEDSVLDDLIQ